MGSISKLINKVNKAKSALKSLKGISSKLQSLNYTSQTDKLGEESKAAKKALFASRIRTQNGPMASMKVRNSIMNKTPQGDLPALMYPLGDWLDNYIVFSIFPRKQQNEHGGANNNSMLNGGVCEISLYVPDGLASTTAATYSKQNFGLGTRQLNKIFNAFRGKAGGPALAIDAAKDGAGVLIANQVMQFMNNITGGLENVRQGRASNPMQEALFEGVEFREFSFAYEFWPKNEAEAEMVNQIIYRFRSALLPDTFGATWGTAELDATAEQSEWGVENYFNFPNVFHVEFDGPIADKIDGFLPMVCTSCDVDHFNGNTNATLPNGQPLSSSMKLTFQEIKLLTQESYQTISPVASAATKKLLGTGMESENPAAEAKAGQTESGG